MTIKNADLPAMPKCQHYRCDMEVSWDRSCYDLNGLAVGKTRYRGKCENCGTNYTHDAEALDALLQQLEGDK